MWVKVDLRVKQTSATYFMTEASSAAASAASACACSAGACSVGIRTSVCGSGPVGSSASVGTVAVLASFAVRHALVMEYNRLLLRCQSTYKKPC